MENLYLYELITAVKGEFLLGDPHSMVRRVSTDTRTLRRGDFYFALTGKNFDGHDYIISAVERNAGGLIISRQDPNLGNPFPFIPSIIRVADTTRALGDLALYYRRKWNIPVVAVTGSNGKTTTKEMLASILELNGPTLKNTGNFNNHIGLPMTLFNLGAQHRYAAIEMGTSSPGEIRRLADIAAPSGGIITNIGMAHLESFNTLEETLAEKTSFAEVLPPEGWIALNNDDPLLNSYAARAPREVIRFGIDKDAFVRARNIEASSGKLTFELWIGPSFVPVVLPVCGKFNIYNALAAAAAAWKLGCEINIIKKGLEDFSPPAMRMEVLTYLSDVAIVNDAYNANPSSMKEALKSFTQSFSGRRMTAVLGDMLELGPGSDNEHRKIGEYLSTLPLENVFLFGSQMEHAAKAVSGKTVKHFTDRENMLMELQRTITPRSAIFFKGSRGMHLEEVINRLFEKGS